MQTKHILMRMQTRRDACTVGGYRKLYANGVQFGPWQHLEVRAMRGTDGVSDIRVKYFWVLIAISTLIILIHSHKQARLWVSIRV